MIFRMHADNFGAGLHALAGFDPDATLLTLRDVLRAHSSQLFLRADMQTRRRSRHGSRVSCSKVPNSHFSKGKVDNYICRSAQRRSSGKRNKCRRPSVASYAGFPLDHSGALWLPPQHPQYPLQPAECLGK
jgi:hypothetical protein